MKSSNGVKKNVRRGFAPEDERQFSAESVQLLRKAGTEVRYLSIFKAAGSQNKGNTNHFSL